MMNLITWISRVFVGLLFIFSGLIKLNDPLGFSYKLEDYFAPDVLNLPFLEPLALPIALFVVILEVLLGVGLLIGYRARVAVWLLLGMIVFFTFLTFYSAYFEKVTDCGCFGDAIPLTPWQSFWKDIILLVFILILTVGQRHIKPLLNHPRINNGIMAATLVACSYFGYHVLNHLPVKDFRPYAVGKNLIEGMKSAEELGKEGPEYQTIFTMRNKNTGEEVTISNVVYSDDKWWEKPDWETVPEKTKFVKVKDGYEPPIHDFVIAYEGEDITWEILQKPVIFLVISKNLPSASVKGFEKITKFAIDAQSNGYEILGLSATSGSAMEEFRHMVQAPYTFAEMDETTLKTIIRANPGILLLKEAQVIAKWHHNDLPDFEKVTKKYLNP
jgi:uncharacterized membrane protein YphA (DoxX/SURF4 family)